MQVNDIDRSVHVSDASQGYYESVRGARTFHFLLPATGIHTCHVLTDFFLSEQKTSGSHEHSRS